MRLRLPALALLSLSAFAYNPPTDNAGPITVSMQPPAVGAYGAGGYADLSRPGVGFSVPVSVQNAGDTEISGTLRMTVIDRWKVEPPGARRSSGCSGRQRPDQAGSTGQSRIRSSNTVLPNSRNSRRSPYQNSPPQAC